MFVNHCCGSKTARNEFKEKVLPLFQYADVSIDIRGKRFNDICTKMTRLIFIGVE